MAKFPNINPQKDKKDKILKAIAKALKKKSLISQQELDKILNGEEI